MLTLARCAAAAWLILSASSPARSAPQDEADRSGRGWSMVHLDLDVLPDPPNERMDLAGVMRLRLDLDQSFGPSLGVNKSKTVMTFVEVESAGATVELNALFALSPPTRFAHVRYAEPKRCGDEVEVKFRCASTGRAYQFVVDPGFACASWVEAWYPVPMPKTLTGYGRATVSAPGRTRFALPENWTAVSGGRRIEEGPGRVVWESSVPLARSFAAGPFTETASTSEGREIGVYLLTPKPYAAKDQARSLAAAIRAMEERFGPFPYAAYAIAEVPEQLIEWWAASEQGFIMAASTAFDVAGGNLPVFAHEAGHAWWGNQVTSAGPGGMLCSESLAQYGVVIAIEALEGVDAATEFLRFSRAGYHWQQCARGYFEMWREGTDKEMSKLSGQGADHTLSDSKGHWVFHMLRDRVGDAAFFGVLRGVVEDRALENLPLAELRRRFIAAAPEANLERFFAQWLDRLGAPVLEEQWTDASDASGHRVRLTIAQEGEPYDLDLEVEVTGADGATTHKVAVREAVGEWVLTSPGTPREVKLDPRHRLLIWKPEYGEKPARAE